MRLNEIIALPQQQKIKFDIIEDALIFMRNDPMFYRKEYFPTITKMADSHRAGENYNAKSILSPMIDSGINKYCKKYNLAHMPDDIFHHEHRQNLLDKIIEDEIKNIEKGDYL